MWRQAWLGASRAVVSGEQGVDLEWRSRQVEKLLDCAAGQEHSATCAHTLLRNRCTTQHHAAGGEPTRPLPEHAHTHTPDAAAARSLLHVLLAGCRTPLAPPRGGPGRLSRSCAGAVCRRQLRQGRRRAPPGCKRLLGRRADAHPRQQLLGRVHPWRCSHCSAARRARGRARTAIHGPPAVHRPPRRRRQRRAGGGACCAGGRVQRAGDGGKRGGGGRRGQRRGDRGG